MGIANLSTGSQATDGFADLDRDTLACYTKPDEVEKGPIHPLAL